MEMRAGSMFLALALVAGSACSNEESGAGGSSAAGGSAAGGSAAGGSAAGGSGAGGLGSGGSGGDAGSGGSGGPGAPTWVWAITIDDPWTDGAAIVDSLASFEQAMTVRIVFDEGMTAAEYDAPVRDIAAVAAVQGELVDSLYVPSYTLAEYVDRANEYLDQLGDAVSIWEVGNEINGEWVGDAAEVSAKMLGAYQAVKAHGGRTALTLYYNGLYDGGQPTENNCWSTADNQMQVWAEANVPAEMKAGLDYVWVSYYEDDCLGIQPDWPLVFADLAAMFPNSQLGVGECGTLNVASKADYVDRYYRDLLVADPRFVGGFFWWWGKQDFVPKTNPLWQTLEDAMNAREATWP